MTAILPLKDVGDPMKPEGDVFSAEDLNRIFMAMKYVLRILTDTQASIRPDTIYIGDTTAGLKRDPDTGQLVIFDSVAGEVRLTNLGALNYVSMPVLGDVVNAVSSQAPVANRMYLRYAASPKAEQVSQIAIGARSQSGSLVGSAYAVLYDTSGNVLTNSQAVTPNYIGNTVFPLDVPIDIDAGIGVWMGVIFNAAMTTPVSGHAVGGHNAKYVDVGSFSIPDPIAIPGTFATIWVPAILGRIAGGVPIDESM
jgi:hypothetical protein